MKEVFTALPGTYGLIVLKVNEPAIYFWRTVFQRNGFSLEVEDTLSDGEKVIRMIAEL